MIRENHEIVLNFKSMDDIRRALQLLELNHIEVSVSSVLDYHITTVPIEQTIKHN